MVGPFVEAFVSSVIPDDELGEAAVVCYQFQDWTY